MAGEQLPAGIDLRADAWATPRMTPPASVPQRLPRPPMITASKPKISRAGRSTGSKLVRTREEDAGDRDDRQRQRHGEAEDVAVVEAHQLGEVRHRRRSARKARPSAVR